MKKFSGILMAVAALFTISCTTDATEDLSVELGNDEGKTILSFSLDESRTHISEKVDGKYPLHWSEGDNIAINGVASNQISIDPENLARAEFVFNSIIERPFNAIYPVPTEDPQIITEKQKVTVEEIDPTTGEKTTKTETVDVDVPLYPVTFPTQQVYTEGTFASGTVPMYGYADENLDYIPLKHLSGVLCFKVKGLNEEVLKKMIITSHTDGLSGTFYVRCSTGALVVKEGSTKNYIEMTFGENGLKLGETAVPIYIVVPAGSYGAINAQLITADDKVMVVKFSTYGEKGFKAGTVREFSEFTFAENSAEANDEGVFEIYTADDLLKFAKVAPVFAPRTEAKLMADIDMTDIEWTPIDGFIHTLNGNNKSIKGLSAPLFGTCEAKVYDLNLTDVAIELGNNLHTGTLANIINNGAVVNCSASGSLIYHQAAPSGVAVGGLVGKVNGCEFSKNTNRVNITIVGEMTEDNLNDYILRVGGLAATLENPAGKMEKSYNYGTINITENVDRLSVGGLIGFVDAALHMDDCHNHGKMLLAANVQGTSFSTFAGISGSIDAGFNTANPTFTVTNCSNNGAIIFGEEGGEDNIPTVGKTVYFTHLGGLFCYTRDTEKDYYDIKLENCTNNGDIDVNAVSAGSHIKLGGFFTQITTDLTMTNCHNNGKIGFTRSVTDGASGTMYIGGLIAHIVGSNAKDSLFSISNSSNNGKLYTSKNIYNAGVLYSGGVAGYVSAASHLSLTNFSNSGALNFANKTKDSNIYIGSLSGYLAGDELTVSGFTNDGDITADVTMDELSNNTYIGGIIGHNGSKKNNKFENVVNNGDISATGASDRFMFAGIVASIRYDMTLDNCQNTGALTLENKQSFDPKHLWYGGIMACILDTSNNITATLNSCTNSGDITLKNTNVTGLLGVAGIAGQLVYASNNTYYGTVVATDCVNEGDILVQNSTAGVDTAIGGIVSATTIGSKKDGQTLLYNPKQTGNITVKHTGTDTSVHLDVGGLVGIFVQGEITKNAANTRGSVSGNFKIDSNNAAGPQWRCIGGVVGEARGAGKISDIDILASGDNSMTINLSTMKGNVFLGGVVGYCPSACEFSNITNSMPLNAKAVTATGGTIFAGGIAAYIPDEKTASFSNITNNGAITTDSGDSTNGTYVGGGFGSVKSQITATDITNNGAISVTASTKMANTLNLGGIVGQNDTAHGNYTNLTNNGSITVKKGGGSYKAIYLGGIAGGQPATENATHTHFNCVNNGDITIEEGVTCTGNIRVSGCITWVKAGYCDKIKNTGDIYMHANTTAGNYQILVGGVFAHVPSTIATSCAGENGGYINTGNIKVTVGTPGSTNEFATTIGGIAGTCYGNLKNAINIGNITFTGDYGTNKSSIGGIIGYGSGQGTVENCIQYGDIMVYPETDPTNNIYAEVTGGIAGSTRRETVGTSTNRTAVVRNCYLGGRILTSMEMDILQNPEIKWTTIDESNYFEYIYRGQNTWTDTNYDDCKVQATKPTIPTWN